MLKVRVLAAMELKRIVKTMASFSRNVAAIMFLEDVTLIEVAHSVPEIFAQLTIEPAGFFHHYQLSRPLVLYIDLCQLDILLDLTADADEVCITAKHNQDSVVNHLMFFIRNTSTNKESLQMLQVIEKQMKHYCPKPPIQHEFKVAFLASYLGHFVRKSRIRNEPVHITITSLLVSFASRDFRFNLFNKALFSERARALRSMDEVPEVLCGIENVPQNMCYELQLPLHGGLANAFISACRIAEVVYIKDTYCMSTSHRTLLEFLIGESCKLQFHFCKPFIVS